ncbi:hypothetical protein [Streptomyces sp. NPDC001833]|uniref:hypothetical protein n=1 Tax=Streptomyces sp. NPDC001833 TaxID=3154658 RepID=UPI00331ECFA8
MHAPNPARAGRATPSTRASLIRKNGPFTLVFPGTLLSTSSFIARRTTDGYSGIIVHYIGQPSHKVPLLLAAFQYRFNRDVDAMARHLIDSVTLGWDTLGTDLLDGAPPSLVTELTGGMQCPSRALDNFLITPDGAPPTRNTIAPQSAAEQDCEWGYVLCPGSIEVISVRVEACWGPSSHGTPTRALASAITPPTGPSKGRLQ